MGCIVSKGYPQKQIESTSQLEYEPVSDGKKDKKKQIHERTLSTRQCKVITDPILTSKYHIKSLIGVGTFSDVFFVEDKLTKLPYAIKYIELRSLKTKAVFQSESNVLKQLKDASQISHPNIVKLNEVITSHFSAYIIMELATGGDLFERIHSSGHIDEKETKRITSMILSAVSYLHSIGITHRDMKPENVLFYKPGADSRIMITDFGFASCHQPNSILNTYCGTLQYLSPELILGDSYSSKADVWAVGVMVYFMLSGHLPFNANDVMSFRDKITRTQHSYKREIWKNISAPAKDFIDCLLAKKESERYTADQAIKHSWMPTLSNVTKSNHHHHHRRHGDKKSVSNISTHSHRGIKREQKYISGFDKIPFPTTNEEIEALKDGNQSNHVNKLSRTKVANGSSCTVSQSKMDSTPHTIPQDISEGTDGMIQNSMSVGSIGNSKGAINLAYEQNHLEQPVENMETNKHFIIPRRYNKKMILMEDLFNTDTSSSYSTCGASSNQATDGTIYAESIADTSMERDEVKHENQIRLPPRHLPSIFKRSLSNVPKSTNHFPDTCFYKRASLNCINRNDIDELLAESTVNAERLDKLFSAQPSSTSSPPTVLKKNPWLNSLDLNKSNEIAKWLTTVKTDNQPVPIQSKNRTNQLETLSKSL